MKKKKKKSVLQTKQDYNVPTIAGIPIETCNIANEMKKCTIGTVYLSDKTSKTQKSNSYKYNSVPRKTITVNNVPTIYVYRGYLNINTSDLEDCYLIINDVVHKSKVRIIVAYNKKNQHYYMSVNQLERLHKQGIFPSVIIRESNEGSEPLYIGEFRQNSELSLYGYKVGVSGLSTLKRHDILKYIINNNILYRYQIISILTGHIALREYRTDKDFSKAIRDWEEDIKFINDYKS